jgi:Xaa-Pro aminopeptidase
MTSSENGALLLFGDTERSAALRHEIPLTIIDALLFAERDGRRCILTSRLERDRIARVLPDAELLDFTELGLRELVENGMDRDVAEREVVCRALAQVGVDRAIVPADFPLALGDRLREAGVQLVVDDAAVRRRRRVKAGAELDGIRLAQRAAEAGMAAAAELLARAEPAPDGRLRLGGEELQTETVREAIRAACAAAGAPCPPDILVSTLWTAFGHDPGTGPLPAGLPITVDLWPRHESSGCWADMTRTFVVGPPRAEAAERIEREERLVRTALERAREAIRPGVTGRELHDIVCDLFEEAGYATQRTAPPGASEGFQFSLGHGVGLEVHEAPLLGRGGRDPLVAGDVVAIEPGLVTDGFGQIRFEDLVLVTDDGSETLTRYPYALAPDGVAR